MSRPQFATREGWLICPECEGRSFSDPLKAFHWPECSRYKEWRFGKNVVGVARDNPSAGDGPHLSPDGDALQSVRPAPPAPTTSELITDKIRDSVLEDLWREVEGSDEW